jgi:uncharacterized DUF497 family protein
MRILPKVIEFQWDQGNIQKNLLKHNVTTQEAEEIFVRKPFYYNRDDTHSTPNEQRFRGLGQTKNKRKLFVVFTIRDEKIRIISVRDMKKLERNEYEKS